MNNIENCLQNKIANSNNKLQPIIFKAILHLYKKGSMQITARMVKELCKEIDGNIDWNQRIPAICSSMERTIECGFKIISEGKHNNDFSIALESNGSNIYTSTNKETLDKSDIKKNYKINSVSNHHHINNKNVIEELKLSENFKIVMICAGEKYGSSFKKYPYEIFVNNADQNLEHHPDDIMYESKVSWRDYLDNNQNDTNLLKAYNLYKNNEYRCLYNKYKKNFYILSAGWGLISSEYKLPKYDITFSKSSKFKNRRNDKNDINPVYHDFNQLNLIDKEDIVFIGGKDYLKLFYVLTQNLPNRKIIYYKGAIPAKPKLNSDTFLFRSYAHSNPNLNTNWHYELANKISNGIIP
jgi:hypothetical protein